MDVLTLDGAWQVRQVGADEWLAGQKRCGIALSDLTGLANLALVVTQFTRSSFTTQFGPRWRPGRP